MAKKEQTEVSRQFDEIYAEHNDPQKREEKKIKENRKKRAEGIRTDLGI